MTPPGTNCIFIIDDDPAVRDALKTLVASVGLEPRCYADADAFLAQITAEPYGCLITDICLPGTDGLQLQRTLDDRGIDIPLIAISAHGDIPMAVEMVRRGAVDFIEKPFRNHVLLGRIREALEIAQKRHRARLVQTTRLSRLASLTPREKDVLTLLIDGCSNKTIARRLSLSPRTVETHRANILRKTCSESVTSLARLFPADLPLP